MSFTTPLHPAPAGIRVLVADDRLVVREGLVLAGIGVGVGLAAAAMLTRLMQGALFGVTPLDAASFAGAPIVLLPIAAAACLIPALRAASTDPAEALRCD